MICPICGNRNIIEKTARGLNGELLCQCGQCGRHFDVHPQAPIPHEELVVKDWEWCGEDGNDLTIYYTNGQCWTYTNVEVRPKDAQYDPAPNKPIIQDFQFSYVSRIREEDDV